ncbi:unnamed protein product [Gongylonema pulchrum]|uniref:Cadherin domain-containing protein n=1 Tax=Gongylonema pulchrum TaxID=637853 RepID=A0A183ETR8_9BILA|nr:unnamed protein product [Gongylonema pulchrum]
MAGDVQRDVPQDDHCVIALYYSTLKSIMPVYDESRPACTMAPRLAPAEIQKSVMITTNVTPLMLEDRTVYRYSVRIVATFGRGERSKKTIDLPLYDESRPACTMAPRLAPAEIQKSVVVTTNFTPLMLEDRTVYRYSVRVVATFGRGERSKKTIDLCSGKQDSHRAAKCIALLHFALRKFRQIRDFAYAYDSASTLFTNQPLPIEEVSRIIIRSNASEELRKILGDGVTATIEIVECREYSHTFRITDFKSSITPDLLEQDRSLRQFFEILTNQKGLRRLVFPMSFAVVAVHEVFLVFMRFCRPLPKRFKQIYPGIFN